jgi:hypothetical protein
MWPLLLAGSRLDAKGTQIKNAVLRVLASISSGLSYIRNMGVAAFTEG